MSQRYLIWVFFFLALGNPWAARAQAPLAISGRVITEGDEPLTGATVLVSGTYLGSSTNSAGEFVIPVAANTVLPLMLSVAYLGYATQRVTVSQAGTPVIVTLSPERAINQVVVAASRQEENILRTPVTVEKVTQTQIGKLSQPDLLGSLTQFKGIDVNMSSLLTNSVSTRGFNSAFSERVIQLVDYMDIQSPTLSSGAGNSLGLPDVDVASVEVLYGPSSALYGANAFNGVVLLNSRDAFTDEGLTVRLRGGQRDYFDGQLRYAQRLGRRLAFKVTGSYLTAKDWLAANYDAQQLSALVPVNNDAGSARGYDAVNRYGDQGLTYSADPASPFYGGPGLAGRTVFAPGWTETELVATDDRAKLVRVVPSVSYLLTDKVKATAEFKFAQGTSTFQNTSRFRSKNFQTNQYRLELKSDQWFIRAFQTQDFGNDSYDLSYLGGFMQNAVNPVTGRSYAADYFTSYGLAYNIARFLGASDADALATARSTAAAAQLQSGASNFNALRRAIVKDNTPGRGANVDASSFLNDVSGQYRFALPFADLIVGGAYREFRLGSNGRLFDDADGQRIRNYEYGGYAQLTKAVLDERLKLAAAGRLDNFKNFGRAFSPRASAVYSLGSDKQHNFRASYGRAFRSPSQIDQYTNIDLIAGVYRGNVGAGYQGYSTGLAASPTSNPANFLASVAPLRLEQVSSYEVGYKGQLVKNLVLDVSYYFSQYRDFVVPGVLIGNVDGSRPTFGQLFAAAPGRFQDARLPTRILVVASNLDVRVRTQGALLSLTYAARRAANFTGNYSFNQLLNASNEVPFYNTPRHKFNVGAFGELGRRLGYSLNYRWAAGHRYESTFAAGALAAYQSVDAQVRYAAPKLGTTFELGGSNLLNTNNVQVYGGPQIGRLAYVGVNVTVK